ncbi:hypothetical protein [Hymenobacter terricola]|uniref:hypothetical protein n=1 Tax=Hymenobacter terricola TaxID=2819236 RepID=UPI001B302FB5|nr:hypothetical protein [Hymenobacter terricola]
MLTKNTDIDLRFFPGRKKAGHYYSELTGLAWTRATVICRLDEPENASSQVEKPLSEVEKHLSEAGKTLGEAEKHLTQSENPSGQVGNQLGQAAEGWGEAENLLGL